MNALTIIIAKYLFIVIIGFAFVVGLMQRPAQRKDFISHLIASGILAFILTKLAGMVYFDPRPFVTNHTIPLIPHASDNGFPSDHTVLSFVIAFAVYRLNQRMGLILMILAALVGVARIHAQLHSPLDIVAAIIIAVIAVIGARSILHFSSKGNRLK